MEYSKIIAVTGLPGLYELLNSKGDGAVVRSLDDQSTKFVSSRVHNFSHLESIEIFTQSDNVNLAEVFKAMKESGQKLPDEKDADGVKNYFETVYPDIDFTRVYASDMKKMIKWFSVLEQHKIEYKAPEPEPEEEVAPPPPKETKPKSEPVKEKKPAEKPKAEEKPAAKKAEEKKPAAKAKAPAKKTAKKAAPKKAAPKKGTKKKK